MNELWKKNLRDIEPYVPGEQSKEKDIIKLNANENPYPPSPKVIEAIKNFNADKLKIYPDANATEFKNAVAKVYGVQSENVFLGNGSDDVIAIAFQSFFNSKTPIAYPDITYSFYPVWCRLFKIPYVTYPLDKDFRINIEDYKEQNGGVVIPNPNAPTSLGEGKEFVEKLLEYNQDSVVIIDEAYVDFGGYSSVELTKKYKNLLVTGTFSKSRCLAGMRIGYAIGDKQLISVMEAVKNSYNSYTVDSLAMAVGTAAVEDEEYLAKTTEKIVNTRNWVTKEFRNLGFNVLESQTNFIFATSETVSIADMFNWLKDNKKIFIRYFNLPRIDNYTRITIGTDEEMEKLILAVKEYLEEK